MPGTVLARIGDYNSEWHQLRGRGSTLVTADDTVLDLVATGATNEWDNKPYACFLLSHMLDD